MRPTPKTNDHWWPVALQSFWTDHSGYIYISRSSGRSEKKKAKNRKIGMKRGNHRIVSNKGKSSWWDRNFEGDFQDIDNSILELLRRVGVTKFETGSFWSRLIQWYFRGASRLPLWKRAQVIEISDDDRRSLVLLAGSLAVRSPRFRRDQSWARFHEEAFDELGAINTFEYWRRLNNLSDSSIGTLQICFLFNPGANFLYGDGFHYGLFRAITGPTIRGHAIIPITPSFALILQNFPSGIHFKNDLLFVGSEELCHGVNHCTMAYSMDHLFSPRPLAYYPNGQREIVTRYSGELENLFEVSSQFSELPPWLGKRAKKDWLKKAFGGDATRAGAI